ncbi:MAG: PIN domain-containing protein [Coriobacteriia bacterium]|nr:PIN domain-containing protein [Coriobacteriia bacterium]
MERRYLLDTNVWLDYFVDSREGHRQAFMLVDKIIRSGDCALVTQGTVKDVFYLVQGIVKRSIRAEVGAVTEADAIVAREIAWGCIDCLLREANILPSTFNDARMALHLRKEHLDYEDNLIYAAAMVAQPATLVTNDLKMLRHTHIPCLSVAEALREYA